MRNITKTSIFVTVAILVVCLYILFSVFSKKEALVPKEYPDQINCSDPVNYNVCHDIKDAKGA